MKAASAVTAVRCFDDSSGGPLCLGEGREACRYLAADAEWAGYLSNSGLTSTGLPHRRGSRPAAGGWLYARKHVLDRGVTVLEHRCRCSDSACE